jgi:hypothetical protein
MVAAMMLLAVLAITGFQDASRQTELVGIKAATLAAYEARPSCDPASQDEERIGREVAQGKLDIAAGLAETVLASRKAPELPLCLEKHAALAALWYGARIDSLLATARPEWLDSQFDRDLVARWRAIEDQADHYQVPAHKRLAPMMVADRAANARHWALADAAFRRAWAAGNLRHDAMSFRYSLLRNWGRNLAVSQNPETRLDARQLLATAVLIADRYDLTGEACRDLETIFGYADCHQAPADTSDPVLAQAQ